MTSSSQCKYMKSVKGKASLRKYRMSVKGQATIKRYRQTEKYKAANRRFYKKNMLKILTNRKDKYVSIYIMGKYFSIFTNGVTQEIKKMIPELKRRVYEDCIKNPAKYLENDGKTRSEEK